MTPLKRIDDQVAERLRQGQLPKPTAELRRRTLQQAREAWVATPLEREPPPRRPWFRGWMGWAAALVLFGLASLLSQALVAPWRHPGPRRVQTLPEVPADLVGDPQLARQLAITASVLPDPMPVQKPKPPPPPKTPERPASPDKP